MRRREFLALFGGAAATVPLSAHAQQRPKKIPRIGIIDDGPIWQPFKDGLREVGYIEGQTIAFETRAANGNPERLAGCGGRTGAAAGRCDRDLWHTGEPRRQDRHLDGSDRHDRDRRSGARGLGAEPGASRRQRHRQHHSVTGPRSETAATRQGDHSVGRPRRAAVESRQRFQCGDPRTVARRGAEPWPRVYRRRGAQGRRLRRRVCGPGARAAGCRAADQRSRAPGPTSGRLSTSCYRTGCRECSKPGTTPRPAA